MGLTSARHGHLAELASSPVTVSSCIVANDEVQNSRHRKPQQGLRLRGTSVLPSTVSGLGYRQVLMYLRGELGLVDAVERIKSETHRFVRQQYKWFRLDDATIHWFDVSNEPQLRIEALIRGFLGESL